jgi:hypothetical protein
MGMNEFKHNNNKVIDVCAEALQINLGFNPNQVFRHYPLFSME